MWRVFAETDALIRVNWRQVEAMARALLERGRLSGGEIRDVVRTAF